MTDPTYEKIIDLAHLSRFKTKQDQYNAETYLGISATAAAASKLANTEAIGGATQPVYFTASGVPAATTYSLAKSVPADAVFTDTTYEAATQSAAGLMSAADKTKLDGIATGAEVNQNAFSSITVGSSTVSADAKTDSFSLVQGSNVTLSVSGDAIAIAATDTTYSEATPSTSGEGGTAGLMSAADKEKLNGVAAGAQVNVLEGVQVNGTDLSISNKKVNITFADGDSTGGLGSIKLNGTAYTVYGLGDAAAADLATSIADGETGLVSGDQVYDYVATALTSALIYKGVKATVADLPSTGQKVGDLWHVTADGGEYAWNGTAWEEMGSVLDLSGYVQFSDITLADNTDIDGLFSVVSE